ncbi:acetyl-CoA carboxylase biotin carboxyl carrier protein subunit [Devosia yakushimensis]|uniref:Biotin carboxyl carrier protein of acetyl-CoA carboxylase n=1 Tax=Devosia yakushimensis TaxID=470028 RepID=A0ABQ5UCS8_9HYPH|nr:biotin/lipoyl-containing protein [Devosia yakushimensis]GLQ09900.1 acetyl-CoA carboxylase biotin carboxyl carrier protein subunit [Devosia yakushimensis]
MDVERLQKIIDWMRHSPLQELEIADGDFKAHLIRGGAGIEPITAAEQTLPGVEITAPSFGIVHLSPTPDTEPFVTTGSRVEAGQTLCIIEAMKVFSPVESDRAGTITAILVAGGAEVSANQPIFRLD